MDGTPRLDAIFRQIEMERNARIAAIHARHWHGLNSETLKLVCSEFVLDMRIRAERMVEANWPLPEIKAILAEVPQQALKYVHDIMVRSNIPAESSAYINERNRWHTRLDVEREAILQDCALKIARQEADMLRQKPTSTVVNAQGSTNPQIVAGNQSTNVSFSNTAPEKGGSWLKTIGGWLVSLASSTIGLFKAQ